MTMAHALPAPLAPARTESFQKIVTASAAFFVFCGMMSLIEPSPYDFASFVAIPLWLIGGVRVSRYAVPILVLWTLFQVVNFLSLTPWWSNWYSTLYQLQSLYLFITVVFFTLFFSERTIPRMQACMTAYAWSAAFSAFVAVLSYIGLFGLDSLTTIEGRVAGTFKDPNAFGSYIPFGAVLFMQWFLLGRDRRPFLQLIGLATVIAGVLLSFSRGSWGATLVGMATMTAVTFVTHRDPAMRRRVTLMGAIVVAALALMLVVVLSQDAIREFFLQRAAVTQEYDQGVTGRFGNQLRSIPMLLERPFGFGPLQFRAYFQLDPHNSYIGAFANGGWAGGFLWLFIVGSTFFVGFRLMFAASPYRDMAQAVFSSLMVLLLQGFQIDIDHWRQLFLMFGMVWGLEIARRKWLARPPQPATLAAQRDLRTAA